MRHASSHQLAIPDETQAQSNLAQATHSVRCVAVQLGLVMVCLVPVKRQQVGVERGTCHRILQKQGNPVGTETQRRVQGAVDTTQHISDTQCRDRRRLNVFSSTCHI